MPETFYLDPDYADFVPGQSRLKFKTLYWYASPVLMLVLNIFWIPFAIMLGYMLWDYVQELWQRSDIVMVILILFIGGYLGLLTIVLLLGIPSSTLQYIRAKNLYSRLILSRFLLDGELTKISNRESIYFPSKRGVTDTYTVRIEYKFNTPNGKVLEGTQAFDCSPVRLVSLPSIGTSVKILYADDDCHILL